uniref:Uncharacterized protein n=1 Tax=Scophthalmus maximus TaxID=52904 RepID=A0A8D3C1Q6_SCOMX
MKGTNRTLLLSLLSRCQQILEDTGIDINGHQINATLQGRTYDNAYFYILFVMIFYSVIAMTLFKCLGSGEEKKDPYVEFITTGVSE